MIMILLIFLRAVLAMISNELNPDGEVFPNMVDNMIEFTSVSCPQLFYDNLSLNNNSCCSCSTFSYENSGITNVLIVSPVYVTTTCTKSYEHDDCKYKEDKYLNENSFNEFICKLHRFREESKRFEFNQISSLGNCLHRNYSCYLNDNSVASLVPKCTVSHSGSQTMDYPNRNSVSYLDFIIVGVFGILVFILSYFLFGVNNLSSD